MSKTLSLASAAALLLSSAEGTNLYQCDLDDYYSGFNADSYSTAASLKAALHNYIDGHDIITYTATTDVLRDLDAQGNGVRGIYSLLTKTDYPDEWNKEHVWARSLGVGDTGADTSDVFNLYACDMNLNSARGNKYFDTCTIGSNGCVSPAGTANEDAASGTMEDSDTWAPPPSVRGDLARVLFYMATRYDGSDSSTTNLELANCRDSSSCGTNQFGNLATLLQWHEDDPVDNAERTRVNKICNDYQGNRNPYVDFPELVDRVFGSGGGGGGGSTPTTESLPGGTPYPTPFPVTSGCSDSVPSGLVWDDDNSPAECDELDNYCDLDIVVDACPATCNSCNARITHNVKENVVHRRQAEESVVALIAVASVLVVFIAAAIVVVFRLRRKIEMADEK